MVGCLTLPEVPEVSLVTLVPLLVASTESAGLLEDLLSERQEEEEEPLSLPHAREKRYYNTKAPCGLVCNRKDQVNL